VVVVDDSIVRGTTSRKIVKMIRDAGAKEVHLRISSPPTRWPCYYGIDTPTRSELIASSHSIDEINQYITSDSLAYLSYDKMLEAVVGARRAASEAAADIDTLPGAARNVRRLTVLSNAVDQQSFCDACFTGDYPVEFRAPPKSRQMR